MIGLVYFNTCTDQSGRPERRKSGEVALDPFPLVVGVNYSGVACLSPNPNHSILNIGSSGLS